MLPHYADGSKQSKKTKETSALQRCTVLVLCVWVLGAAVFCLHRKNAGGFLGLALLGPHSASGIFWLDKVNAFFQSIEQQVCMHVFTRTYEYVLCICKCAGIHMSCVSFA